MSDDPTSTHRSDREAMLCYYQFVEELREQRIANSEDMELKRKRELDRLRRCRAVVASDGRKWDSIQEAANALGVGRTTMAWCLNEHRPLPKLGITVERVAH